MERQKKILLVSRESDELNRLYDLTAEAAPDATVYQADQLAAAATVMVRQRVDVVLVCLDANAPDSETISSTLRESTGEVMVLAALVGRESSPDVRAAFLHQGFDDVRPFPDSPCELASYLHMLHRLVQTQRVAHGLSDDSSDRKQGESEQFRTLFENLRDPFFRMDLWGRILLVSPSTEQVLGYGIEELAGRLVDDLCVEKEEGKKLRRVLLDHGHAENVELQLRRKDGLPVWVSFNAHLATNADGHAVAIEGLARDISARKATEAENEQLQNQLLQTRKREAIGQLAGGIAHDFNNMLMVILNAAELIRHSTHSDSEIREDVGEILEVARRGRDLVNQLLAFSRRQRVDSVELNLNDVVRDTRGMLQNLFGESVTVKIDEEPELHHTHADKAQIQQLILNIAVNAQDAMPDGGTFEIKTENVVLGDHDGHRLLESEAFQPGNYVAVRFADTGVGMDQETMNRIFDPYFTTKGLANASGLGLAAVYGMVKQHGGFVEVSSNRDFGTSFSVYLPAIESEPSALEPEQDAAAEAALPRGTETVLVVEDEPTVRTMVCKMVRRLGYHVVEACDGPEALEKAESAHVDLMISDVVMPGMDGATVLQKLDERFPGLRVIFMSGYDEAHLARYRVFDNSRVVLLRKPFENAVLARRIRELLGNANDEDDHSACGASDTAENDI